MSISMSNTSTEVKAGAISKPKFSVAISSKGFQQIINNTIRDKNDANQFVASLISAVSVNPELQKCENGSILATALLGHGLKLSPSPQLGHFYMVPFKIKAKYDKQGNMLAPEMMKAQFILGYKGYLQLAQRSGLVKKINVVAVKSGEFVSWNPYEEEFKYQLMTDWDERETSATVGYYAFFELVNGFKKCMYWSKEQMLYHADRFSPAFSKDMYKAIQEGKIAQQDMWKYSSFWYKNFDDMACKTMIRQLISKGGCPMSVEMQRAFENDESLNEVDENGNIITPSKEDDVILETNQVNEQVNNPEITDVVEQANLDDF